MEDKLIKLKTIEGFIVTDGTVFGKVIYCLESTKDTFQKMSDEHYEEYLKNIPSTISETPAEEEQEQVEIQEFVIE